MTAATTSGVASYVSARLPRLKRVGDEYRGPCEIHGGTRDSFAINAETGLWKCFSECDRGGDLIELEQALTGATFAEAAKSVEGLTGATPDRSNGSNARIVATYDYVDEVGELLYQVVRLEPKSFRQRRPDGRGGWIWSLGDVRPVLYRLNKLRDAAEVIIVEGEKDADTLERLGFTASTNSGGAGQPWRENYTAALTGKTVFIIPDADTPGDKHAAKIMAALTEKSNCKLVTLPLGFKDITEYIESGHGADEVRRLLDAPVEGEIPATETPARVHLRRFSDIEPEPIRWLWKERIARGKLTMLAGNPGLGKSQLTASIAATVSRGGAWPDGGEAERGNVLILNAEDDAADTIGPRLMAAGADTARVYSLDSVTEGHFPGGRESRRPFDLREDVARLREAGEQVGGVALIIIDPVTAYLGATDSHKNAEIRALLAPLSEFAAEAGAAVVCVSHLNKGGGADALLRVMGSLAFVAAARAAWLVAKDPDDEELRLFLPLKNNIARDGGSGLAFHVEGVDLQTGGGPIETSRVAWHAGAVHRTADEVMAASRGGDEERGALDEAVDWLGDLLADGPIPSKKIRAAANGEGLSWRTVERAKKALNVTAGPGGYQKGWYWKLPDNTESATDSASHKTLADSGNIGGLWTGNTEYTSVLEEVEL